MARTSLHLSSWLALSLAVWSHAAPARAQVPAQMPVQGYLTTSDGTPVDGDNSITFSLFAGELGGAPLFTETQTVRVDEGYFTAYVGDMGTLDLSLFRDNPQVHLEIQVGGDPPMSPRLAMGTVPYAAVAQYAISGGTASGVYTLAGSVTGTTIGELATFEIEIPGPGSMVIVLNADAFVDCDSTAGTSRVCSLAALGICDVSADSTSCEGAWKPLWHEDPDDASGVNQEQLITVVRHVSAVTAGPRRFYLNGRGPDTDRQIAVRNAQIIAIYTPGPPLAINP